MVKSVKAIIIVSVMVSMSVILINSCGVSSPTGSTGTAAPNMGPNAAIVTATTLPIDPAQKIAIPAWLAAIGTNFPASMACLLSKPGANLNAVGVPTPYDQLAGWYLTYETKLNRQDGTGWITDTFSAGGPKIYKMRPPTSALRIDPITGLPYQNYGGYLIAVTGVGPYYLFVDFLTNSYYLDPNDPCLKGGVFPSDAFTGSGFPDGFYIIGGHVWEKTTDPVTKTPAIKDWGTPKDANGKPLYPDGVYPSPGGTNPPATQPPGTTPPPNNPPPPPASGATLVGLTIYTNTPTVSAGTKAQFNVIGTMSDGSTDPTVTNSVVTWQSDNTSVATIDNTGLATTLVEGTANIKATYRNLTSNPIPLTVTPPELTKIIISPANASTSVFDVTGFTAYGSFSNNTGRDMTNEVSWSSGGGTIINPLDQYVATYPTLASVYYVPLHDPSHKYYIGLSNGTATISAASSGISGTADIMVGCSLRYVAYSMNDYPTTAYDTYFYPDDITPHTIGTNGTGTAQNPPIYGKGCAVTAYSMVFATLGQKINGQLVNPVNLNQWLIDKGGYSSGGYIKPGKISAFPGAPSTVISTTDKTYLDNAIKNCKPIIAGVTTHLGNPHFVVVTGKKGDDYVIIDPYSYRTASLKDYYGNNINQVIIF